MKPPPSPTSWLWRSAIAVFLAGVGLLWLLWSTSVGPQEITPAMRSIALLTVVISGILLIAASARWWMHR